MHLILFDKNKMLIKGTNYSVIQTEIMISTSKNNDTEYTNVILYASVNN